MIYRKIPVYDYGKLKFDSIENKKLFENNFYIKLPKLLKSYDAEKTLLNIPNVLEIKAVCRTLGDGHEENFSVYREGGFYFNEKGEWLLEAVCHMQTCDKTADSTYVLRLPLSAPFIEKGNIALVFDGVWVRFMQNGEILNENSGMDMFCEPNGEVFVDESFKGVEIASFDKAVVTYREQKVNSTGAFYFPHGFNTYVGDVMSFFHNGVYHIMYLVDRRHHGSRNGAGAHYICHMTSENLTDWYEQTPIAEIYAPWVTYGTGTMLFHNGKYYMTYGLHTERYKGANEQIEPRYIKDEGFEHVSYDKIHSKGALPAGASYSVSENGIDFTPSEILFHSARNPSAYLNENGGIVAYCGYGGEGVFEADSFSSHFKKSEKNFDFVKNSLMRNTSECPCFFDWNGYKYLIVGCTGYFRTTEKGSSEFVDATSLNENIYEGLTVPMVTSFKGNRMIISGWTETSMGWGGVMMQRELIQEEGGRLGMKWVPEMLPELKSNNLVDGIDVLSQNIPVEWNKNYSLCLDIDPQNAECIALSLDNGEKAVTLEIDIPSQTAQINDAPIGDFASHIETPREQFLKLDPKITNYNSSGLKDIPRYAVNYRLPDIRGVDERFKLKVLLHYSRKLRACVIDAEIAERRTLISVRTGFFPTNLSLLNKGDISIEDAVLKEFVEEE